MYVFVEKNKKLLKIIFIVIIYSLIPLIGLNFYISLGQREESLKTAKKEVDYVLTQLANKEKEIVAQMESFLFTISQLEEIHNFNSKECNKLLVKLYNQHKIYKNIAVVNLQGDIICAAVLPSSTVNVADRKYFINAVSNRKFSLGDYQIGRIVKTPIWVAGYPVITEDEVLQSVVIVSIDLNWLSKQFTNKFLPKKTTIEVFDNKAVILASYPDSKNIGQTRNNNEISYALEGKETPFKLKGEDGIVRIYSYLKFEPTSSNEQKYIVIGVPESYYSEPIDKAFQRSLILIAIITSSIFLIVFINWRFFIYTELNNI